MTEKSCCLGNKERWLWCAITLVLAVLNGYQFWSQTVSEEETPVTQTSEAQPAPSESHSNLPVVHDLARSEGLDVLEEVHHPDHQALNDYQRRRLQRLGLAHPKTDILADLLSKPELIPLEPVMGGTMYFIQDEMHLLSDHWVLATYEDGHVQGRALFEYQVSPQGDISWRVLASATN